MLSAQPTSPSQEAAPPGASAAVADHASFLVCSAEEQIYALPLEQLAEIMRVLPIKAIAGAPRAVRGLCIIRGLPVPVVDAGLLFGDQACQAERLVVVKVGDRMVALAVESVLGIRSLAIEYSNRLPPLLQDAAGDTVAAVAMLDAELMFFLHTARIVPDDVFAHLSGAQASA
jgi:purine-binding chemotaxis protein CheW